MWRTEDGENQSKNKSEGSAHLYSQHSPQHFADENRDVHSLISKAIA